MPGAIESGVVNLPPAPISAARRAAAISVHLLTAGGAVCGLLALEAIGEARLKAALGWMALAMAIDGLDGSLARRVGVTRAAPTVDGALLDNLVDYVNYVLVPAYLILEAGLLPAGLARAGAASICLASAFQFSNVEAKSAEHGFKGFPSYWNVVAFYLLFLRLPPWIALAVVAGLCLMVFAPLRFTYPSRAPKRRALNLTLVVLWGASLGGMLFWYPQPSRWLLHASLLYPAYYVGTSLKRSWRT